MCIRDSITTVAVGAGPVEADRARRALLINGGAGAAWTTVLSAGRLEGDTRTLVTDRVTLTGARIIAGTSDLATAIGAQT